MTRDLRLGLSSAACAVRRSSGQGGGARLLSAPFRHVSTLARSRSLTPWVKGEGLVRKLNKSRAGERVLTLPDSVVAMLRSRFMVRVWLNEPVFPNTFGGLRDPSNTRRELRDARGPACVGDVTQLPQDRGHDSGSRRPQRAIGCRSARRRAPFDDSDVYLGRRAANPAAAEALEPFLSHDDPTRSTNEKDG